MRPSQLTSLLVELLPSGLSVLIKGRPGVGKTDIVNETAKRLGMDIVTSHPVVSDPTDYKGLPFVIDKHAEFLPFDNLRILIDAKKPTINFLDDLGQAPPAVQAAVMQLLWSRMLDGKKISDNVVFVAATNRKEDKASVAGILEPVKSRFTTIVELEADHDEWTMWAMQHKMPQQLIAFINARPNLLCDFQPTSDIVNTPTPRTVANLGMLMNCNLSDAVFFEAAKGAVGEGFVSEFRGFLDVYKFLPDPKEALKNPDDITIPTDPSTKYAFLVGLVFNVTKKTMGNFVTIMERLGDDFAAAGVNMVVTMAKDKKLCETDAYALFVAKHQEILAG